MERSLEVKAHLHNLSLLVMSPVRAAEACAYVAGLSLEARTHFLKLADAHHVVIRALEPLEQAAVAAVSAKRSVGAAWIANEQAQLALATGDPAAGLAVLSRQRAGEHPSMPRVILARRYAVEAELSAARARDLQLQLPALTAGEGVFESTFGGYQPVSGEPPTRRQVRLSSAVPR